MRQLESGTKTMQRLGVLDACSMALRADGVSRAAVRRVSGRLDVTQGGDGGTTVSEAWKGLAMRGSRLWFLLNESQPGWTGIGAVSRSTIVLEGLQGLCRNKILRVYL